MELYAGIDLHSNNNFVQIIDGHDKTRFSKRLPNNIEHILNMLASYKDQIQTIAVESTFNWYWLVDGLMDNGYKVRLANPAAIKQYEGLKHTDDRYDAFLLAHLQRLGILPTGYIYPKQDRGVRDLLRRRTMFVQQKTTHILSLQSMISRNLGVKMPGNEIKKLTADDAKQLFDDPNLVVMARCNIETMHFLKMIIRQIEKIVKQQAKLRKEYEQLLTITGIGTILALTIMFEVGDIGRFKKVGNYSSYCRCVNSNRLSNGKKKGENNKKNGNRHLAWAYVEAANFMKRYCSLANAFYQRKMAKQNNIVATKALSNKICRASYFVMRDQVAYDAEKLFCR
jgi:transposase